jgi:uncharacterized protein YidB (DUF937 family)
MDLNQLMQLANNPQVRQLIKGLVNQLAAGQGGQANAGGLLDQLQKAGMGDQVRSWMSTGPNQEVSAEQITQALGSDRVDALAREAGLPPQEAASDIAQVVPVLVDQASPSGQLDVGALKNVLSQLSTGGR